jgi:hypothetical protein
MTVYNLTSTTILYSSQVVVRTTRIVSAAVSCFVESKDDVRNRELFPPLHAYFSRSYEHEVKALI